MISIILLSFSQIKNRALQKSVNVLPLIGVTTSPYFCVVTEMMSGGNLEELLYKKQFNLTLKHKINILRQVQTKHKIKHKPNTKPNIKPNQTKQNTYLSISLQN